MVGGGQIYVDPLGIAINLHSELISLILHLQWCDMTLCYWPGLFMVESEKRLGQKEN